MWEGKKVGKTLGQSTDGVSSNTTRATKVTNDCMGEDHQKVVGAVMAGPVVEPCFEKIGRMARNK